MVLLADIREKMRKKCHQVFQEKMLSNKGVTRGVTCMEVREEMAGEALGSWDMQVADSALNTISSHPGQ